MQNTKTSARTLLDAAYRDLQFNEGSLLSATIPPADLPLEQWVEKGEWLSIAKEAKAEKIFFVDNNPVIIFAETSSNDEDAFRQAFNRTWCMARPMLLFVARQGELAVYNLARQPIRTSEEWKKINPLDVAHTVSEVATALQKYHREQVESGKLFEDERFGNLDHRADKSLIHDLKTVRTELRQAGLDGDNLKYAHALIGRSIFIRYLEDRGILIKKYFDEVAEKSSKWKTILNDSFSKPVINSATDIICYPRILADREFTYSLFDRLSQDFNGDIFPTDLEEKAIVTQAHLNILRDFLLADAGAQKKLFFWAYKFNIIPLELISSIYEEFYHTEKGKSDNKATHYTPGSLVEFVISQVLSSEVLESNPRILDPACGSGIFLVEAFRRIVRYKTKKQKGRRLNAHQLRNILRNQIAGIEINGEAVQVAAFSLYLALLNYQEPKDILEQIEKGNRLPNLKYQRGIATDEFHFNNLLEANTFDVEFRAADPNQSFPFMEEDDHLPFIGKRFDAVVGNPPWGTTDKVEKAQRWCEAKGLPLGDKESSQAFMWKSLDLLSEGGCAGLLVSTGIFFKHQNTSKEFRRKWLESVKLKEVVNFAHVRHVFFNSKSAKGVAPFASIVFQKKSSESTSDHPVRYWSAKKTAQAIRLQAVILNRYDLRLLTQDELLLNDKLWKIYWWGNHHDKALISWLESSPTLEMLKNEDGKRLIDGQGFTLGKTGKKKPSDWLLNYDQLPIKFFKRYGQLRLDVLKEVPKEVYRRGVREVFEGTRLLIKRGISQHNQVNGHIIARIESAPFSFDDSLYGIKLVRGQEWEYKILLAIFWSSLARYYYFLTNGMWGLWHYKLHLEELEKMPIRFPENAFLQKRIVEIVDELRNCDHTGDSLFNLNTQRDIPQLEHELDEAIFDLYELDETERDQIRDMCEIGLEFFYNHYKSDAVKPVEKARPSKKQGFIKNISSNRRHQIGLEGYIRTFLQIWNRQLEPDNEFSWQIVSPGGDNPMIGVIFAAMQKGEALAEISISDENQWQEILHKLSTDLLIPYRSKRIYIDGIVRAITDTDIIIIKRDEKRLWTRSMAREDAEAIIVQAMNQNKKGV